MITCTLPTSIQRPDEAASRIYAALIQAGAIDLASAYATQSYRFRDPHEAVQTALRLTDELAINWQPVAADGQ